MSLVQCLCLFVLLWMGKGLAQTNAPLAKARCDLRRSIAFLGITPTDTPSADPKAQIDAYIRSDIFIERFASWINAQFNEEPGTSSAEDAPYHLVKAILAKYDDPSPDAGQFKQVFVGPYTVVASGEGDDAPVEVRDDPNGLGYFNAPAWKERYAGNELAGLRIITAYNMINNILGTHLIATTNAPDADVSATGRQAPACRGCHFDNWFALDPIAEALSRVERDADGNITGYSSVDGSPKKVFGNITVNTEKELLEKMVESPHFKFNACRMAFKFLYNRAENSCEAGVFDNCVKEFTKTGKIQDAIKAVANDSSFCQ